MLRMGSGFLQNSSWGNQHRPLFQVAPCAFCQILEIKFQQHQTAINFFVSLNFNQNKDLFYDVI